MFEIAQTRQAESVSVAHLVRAKTRDRRVPDDETLPFPRRGLQAEEVTDENTVRAGVRHHQNLAMFGFEAPHGQR